MLQHLDQLKLTSDSWVLDYGCGVGRLAKVMIEHYGCRVVGVDISSVDVQHGSHLCAERQVRVLLC